MIWCICVYITVYVCMYVCRCAKIRLCARVKLRGCGCVDGKGDRMVNGCLCVGVRHMGSRRINIESLVKQHGRYPTTKGDRARLITIISVGYRIDMRVKGNTYRMNRYHLSILTSGMLTSGFLVKSNLNTSVCPL